MRDYSHEQVLEIMGITYEFGESLNAYLERGYNPGEGLFRRMVPYRKLFVPFLRDHDERRGRYGEEISDFCDSGLVIIQKVLESEVIAESLKQS